MTSQADGDGSSPEPRYVLRLYVTGSTPRSARAIENMRRICEEYLAGRYDLEVIEPPIPKTIKFAEAPAAGRSILATSRSSKGAKAYREVAANLVTRAGRG